MGIAGWVDVANPDGAICDVSANCDGLFVDTSGAAVNLTGAPYAELVSDEVPQNLCLDLKVGGTVADADCSSPAKTPICEYNCSRE